MAKLLVLKLEFSNFKNVLKLSNNNFVELMEKIIFNLDITWHIGIYIIIFLNIKY